MCIFEDFFDDRRSLDIYVNAAVDDAADKYMFTRSELAEHYRILTRKFD